MDRQTEKLRLMISYGGHIIPRPNTKILRYIGGVNRIITVPRHAATTTTTLTTHITKLLPAVHHPFTIKYLLPSQDFDSLITISTAEDLANMLEEYDRLLSLNTPSRIRFFLFPNNSSDSPVLHDPKTDGWFFDAMRTAGGLGESVPDSISVEERERDKNSSIESTGSSSYSPMVRGGDCGGGGVHFHDVKVVLPSVDSLGSDTSIPSPNYSQQGIVYQDASCFPESVAVSATVIETESNASDRSPRSDVLTPIKVSGYVLSKPVDQSLQQVPSSPPPTTPPPQYIHYPTPQHSFATQYYTGSVPVASYPTMYQPFVQAQQPIFYQQPIQCQMDKPYPVYMMPVGQAQNPYYVSSQYPVVNPQCITPGQPHVAQNPIVTPSQSQVAPKPVLAASHIGCEGYSPAAPAPEYSAKIYSATVLAARPETRASNDHHQQAVAFPPVNPSSQPVAVSTLENNPYVSEYEDPLQAQIYKTQPSEHTLPSQFQTTANAPSVMLSENFTQLKVDNTKH